MAGPLDNLPDRDSASLPEGRFCRYEFKYLLPRGLAAPIRAFVTSHLPHDRHSEIAPDHTYRISSLYLDSDDLRLCRESLSGQKNRIKLRIRCYDDELDNPVYLEIKRRLNTVILKDRCPISRDDLEAYTEAVPIGPESATAAQFRFYRAYLAARPQALVRYRREAFEGRGPSRVRITLDRDIQCLPTSDWQVKLGGPGWRRVIDRDFVLEIKFNGRYPAWLQTLVRTFQLKARSVSKYTLSLTDGLPAAGGLFATRRIN